MALDEELTDHLTHPTREEKRATTDLETLALMVKFAHTHKDLDGGHLFEQARRVDDYLVSTYSREDPHHVIPVYKRLYVTLRKRYGEKNE